MLIVIFAFFVLLFVMTFIVYKKNYADFVWFLRVIFAILAIACVGVFTLLIPVVPKSNIIDDKIAMYQQENKSIETSISKVVENYKDYEKEVFKDVKPDAYIAVATQVYPELKSNELVKQQIKLYTDNNKKIKELKEEKLDYRVLKWWLYFGG